MLFSLPEMVSDKKIRVDFDYPDISSNGGLVLIGNMHNSLAWKKRAAHSRFPQKGIHPSYLHGDGEPAHRLDTLRGTRMQTTKTSSVATVR